MSAERDSDEEIEITVDVEGDLVEIERADLVVLNRQGNVVVTALRPPNERGDPIIDLCECELRRRFGEDRAHRIELL